MQDNHEISRRTLLRAAAGSLSGLVAGNLLAGCSHANSSLSPSAGPDMFVTTYLGNTVDRYRVVGGGRRISVTTGIGPGNNPPGSGAAGVLIGIDNDYWVCNRFQDSVGRYNIKDNTLRDTLQNVHAPHRAVIGNDKRLYVPSAGSYFGTGFGSDSIETFDALTGAHIGTFAQINGPLALVWGSDNFLYASSVRAPIVANPDQRITIDSSQPNSDSIVRFDHTGQNRTVVVGNITTPFDFLFAPGGTLLISEFLNNRIQRYDPATGQSLGTFASVTQPFGMALGPDGDLYVSTNTMILAREGNEGRVLRFDVNTGALKEAFVSNLSYAGYLTFNSPVL